MNDTVIRKSLCAAATSLAILAAPSPSNAGDANPLVGSWTWTRPQNKCTETYTYRRDGTYSTVSGAERTEGTYTLSAEPDAAGFYEYADHVTKDFGGRDCADSDADITGEEAHLFIAIHASGEQILICFEPGFDKCFGPLRKVGEKWL